MNSSVTKIPCSIKRFFKLWLESIQLMHKLTDKDMNILAHLLYRRFELSKSVTDDELLDSYLFSKDIKEQVIEDSGESKANFSVTLSKLRKQGVILEGNKINKKFIPNINKDSKRFEFVIIFDLNDTK